ncbi:MAG: ActS/PrrB/RegB family redox-sensitive histidine kinase [Candidatus Pacebacteria bacterium]|nr:ActS/PrrB/RegB family redox-sensitive histidine kinase [Candidatus Paceibacterota bacterium]
MQFIIRILKLFYLPEINRRIDDWASRLRELEISLHKKEKAQPIKREFRPATKITDRLLMPDASDKSFLGRSIRLGVMLNIRWVSILSQLLIIGIFKFALGFPIDLLPLTLICFVSIGINLYLASTRFYSEWLREREAFWILFIDLVILAAILFYTGGIENPFVILLLIPSTIGVTILTLSSSIILTVSVLFINSFLSQYHMALPWPDPIVPLVPPLYIFCTWLSINLATLFISSYSWQIAIDARRMNSALNETQIALLREKRISALGALAASAAHELGSPLSTIAVIARELSHEIPKDSPIYPDIELMISETIRCRDILTLLSNRPESVVMFERIPISHLIMELGENHRKSEDKQLVVTRYNPDNTSEPELPNNPEFIHGLDNLIHNAFQFAESKVVVSINWTLTHLFIVISDDGPGFSPAILSKIGEPYLSSRTGVKGHMGLGIFIATTLLQRSKATVSFANQHYGGAEIRIHWNRQLLAQNDEEQLLG